MSEGELLKGRKQMKTFVIGDIHGCRRAFQKLLLELKPDPGQDRIILLGDLFDRGPDSWGVLQIVKKLAEDFEERFILLRGNHEDYLLQPYLSLSQRLVWERVGRRTAVRSFRAHGERLEDSAQWIREHSALYYREEKFYCVHAGLKIEPPEANDTYTLVHDHEIVLKNRYHGLLAITGHIAIPVPSYFAGDGKTVKEFAQNQWQNLPANGIICIDAGCGKGGFLVGMEIAGDRFVLRSAEE